MPCVPPIEGGTRVRAGRPIPPLTRIARRCIPTDRTETIRGGFTHLERVADDGRQREMQVLPVVGTRPNVAKVAPCPGSTRAPAESHSRRSPTTSGMLAVPG